MGVTSRRRFCIGAGALSLAGNAAAEPAGEGGAAAFDLFAFFDGVAVSRGTVTTALIFTEAFTATFSGDREGDRLTLDEHFAFGDRRPSQHWELERADGRYRGTVRTELESGSMAPPVAVIGRATPDGALLGYDGYAPGGEDVLLGFRHAMRDNGDGTVTNRVTVSKFGVPIATSQVVFAPTRAALERRAAP